MAQGYFPIRRPARAARTGVGLAVFRLKLEPLEDRCLLSVLPLYYSFDGSGNNRAHSTWGAANTDLLRGSPYGYGDGVSSMAGADRADARAISNIIAVQQTDPEINDRNMSDMIYGFP
jgi:hypothetical protein